jgi:hypothetical protein
MVNNIERKEFLLKRRDAAMEQFASFADEIALIDHELFVTREFSMVNQ